MNSVIIFHKFFENFFIPFSSLVSEVFLRIFIIVVFDVSVINCSWVAATVLLACFEIILALEELSYSIYLGSLIFMVVSVEVGEIIVVLGLADAAQRDA